MTRQIVFDTETTGLEPAEGHRIVEIGCVELRNRRVVGEQRWYLDPGRDSDAGALEKHGLTSEFLRGKPRFAEIADDLLAWLRGAELVIHNAAFDVGFIDHELALAGRTERIGSLCPGVIDTIAEARRLHPGQRASLDALCKRYSIDNAHRSLHGALLDARLLAEVYLAMTGGQSALGLDRETDAGAAPAHAALAELFAGPLLPLRVIRADARALAAHAERLHAIGKKSGKILWRDEASGTTH